jgi:hypothetical protein
VWRGLIWLRIGAVGSMNATMIFRVSINEENSSTSCGKSLLHRVIY